MQGIIDVSKCFFGFRRWDSLTNILVTLVLPSFETVIAMLQLLLRIRGSNVVIDWLLNFVS